MEGELKIIVARYRDKAIRSLACAAICGLSISFAFGEALNTPPQILQDWQSDPAIAPTAFPVFTPYIGLAKALKKSDWQNDLVAVNSRGIGEPEQKIAPTTLAALPVEPKNEYKQKIAKTDKQVMAVQAMLVSVQNAEAKLVGASVHDKVKTRAASPDQNQAAVVHGRLLPIGSGVLNGHFELGLYSSVNAQGLPVGYPVAQQILPVGVTDFSLKASVSRGYLFARYSNDNGDNKEHWFAPTTNPIDLSSTKDVVADIMFHPAQAAPAVVAARSLVKAEEKISIHGHVATMFTHAGQSIAQGGATIKLRGGSNATTTNAQGDFTLTINAVDGPLLLEVIKAGYMPSIVRVGPQELHDGVSIELASKDAIDQLANALGLRQSMAKSVFIGKTGPDVSVQLSLHAEGPYYFNKDGFPVVATEQRTTNSDGRFLYFNVESGVGYLEATEQGESLAPILVSSVDGGGLIYKQLIPVELKLQGRVLNPVGTNIRGVKSVVPVASARVKLAGSSEWTTTDAFGAFEMATVKAFRGEDVALELSADKYYNHRYVFTTSSDSAHATPLNLFAFPSTYINTLAESADVVLDPYAGVILGGVGHRALRVDALAEQADTNNAKDYYFDAHGALKGSFAQTDKNFGTYIIFNVPRGRVLLHGLDNAGSMQYSNITYTSPSTINVVLQ